MLFKRKEDIELEREMRIRRALAALRKVISTLEAYYRKVYEMGRRAVKEGDEEFAKKQAVKCMKIREKIKSLRRTEALLEELRIERDVAKVLGDFTRAMRDIAKSMERLPSTKELAEAMKGAEKATVKAEATLETLDIIVDRVSEGIIGGEELAGEGAEGILESMKKEVEIEETAVDKEIERELEKLKEE